ncbi:venom allergen 3-like [Amblyomma americanum]
MELRRLRHVPSWMLVLSLVVNGVLPQLLTGVLPQLCAYNDPRHSICRFRPLACPGKQLLRSGGVTRAQQVRIVDLHNQLRAWVAGGYQSGLPPAANMRALSWDDELATIAQRWADQCTDGHDKERSVSRFHVGQNVALVWTYDFEDDLHDEPDWDSQVYAWYNEATEFHFKSSSISPFQFSKKLGHFTQLVWANTHKVGCGYAYYRQSVRGLTKIYVCNYGPGGNIIGGSMYEQSPVATCRPGLVPAANTYSGLCDKDPYYAGVDDENEDLEDTFGSSATHLVASSPFHTSYQTFLLNTPTVHHVSSPIPASTSYFLLGRNRRTSAQQNGTRHSG